jgi:hypothetical protein
MSVPHHHMIIEKRPGGAAFRLMQLGPTATGVTRSYPRPASRAKDSSDPHGPPLTPLKGTQA